MWTLGLETGCSKRPLTSEEYNNSVMISVWILVFLFEVEIDHRGECGYVIVGPGRYLASVFEKYASVSGLISTSTSGIFVDLDLLWKALFPLPNPKKNTSVIFERYFRL